MSDIRMIEKESQDLGLHVDLCAQRYQQLESRLQAIETKVENLHQDLQRGSKSLAKVIISSTATILAGLMGLVATLIIKF